jgi:hypothetical protein
MVGDLQTALVNSRGVTQYLHSDTSSPFYMRYENPYTGGKYQYIDVYLFCIFLLYPDFPAPPGGSQHMNEGNLNGTLTYQIRVTENSSLVCE